MIVDKDIALFFLRNLRESLSHDAQRPLGPMVWCERCGNETSMRQFYVDEVIAFLEGRPNDVWSETCDSCGEICGCGNISG